MATENNNVPEINQEPTQEAVPASPEADSTATETKTDEGVSAPEQKEPDKPSSEPEPAPKNDNSADNEVIENLKGENYALKAGVKAECTADVLALAKSRVTDKVPLEKAIDLVVEAYPQFKGAPVPSITTSAKTSNDDVSEADDSFVNRIMGIK